MALGSTQPLTEMSTRNLRGGKRRPAREADNVTAICEPIVLKMWEPRRPTHTQSRMFRLYWMYRIYQKNTGTSNTCNSGTETDMSMLVLAV
jgi:hypothetical protein